MAEKVAYGGASKTSNEFAEKAAQGFDKVTDQVESIARSAAGRGREMGENVQVVADNLRSAVDSSVKKQPMTTLAIAAAVGFVLGALWKT